MSLTIRRAVSVIGLSLFLQITNSAKTDAVASKPVEVIRVGITEYAKVQRTYDNYERLFVELAASSRRDESVKFDFAVGTYGEVLDWYNKRMIDVAVFSAMPVGELLLAGEENNLKRAYIGDLSVTAAHSPGSPPSLMPLFADRALDPYQYRTGAIVLRADREMSALADEPDPFAKIKAMWDRGDLKLLFVRPYSLSGYIGPVSVLRKHGIDPLLRQEQMDFTYDHAESLKRLAESQAEGKPPSHLLDFVLDDTRFQPADPSIKPEDMF